MRNSLLAFAVLLVLGNCTAEAVYNSVQQNHLRQCEELPIPMQADCKDQYQLSYEDYERERQDLIREAQQAE